MARKSRYKAGNHSAVKEIAVIEKNYKAAVYARLSVEDSYNNNGTIENQISLVRKYIESNPYLKLCKTFVDNGQTGTNFNREGFQNLMEAVKLGEIDCIVVKDLSRLGRDYIETGNYIEKVFPFLGVRFISVNDGYDSHDSAKNKDNLTVILKNLINDVYVKDISKKVRSAMETMQKKGEYVGNQAPYGYLKSPENKHRLVINEDTAPTVREIFKWKLGGMSSIDIARKLNERGEPSPRNYSYMKGISKHPSYAKKTLWNDEYIRDMLSNAVYIGNMVQGKTKSDITKNQLLKPQPKENWITVENTHEPIIDTADFETVQKMLDRNSREYRSRQGKDINIERAENIFNGLLYCANCGKNLKRKQQIGRGIKMYYNFICPSYSINISTECVRKYISELKLKKIVFAAINKQIELLSDMETEVDEINSFPETKDKEHELMMNRQEIEKDLTRLASRKNSLYNDFKDGLLTESEYNYIRNKYENDINSLTSKLNEITAEIKRCSIDFFSGNKYLLEFKQYGEAECLSREMLTALIENICIYNDTHIEINFKYTDEFEQVIEYITEFRSVKEIGVSV